MKVFERIAAAMRSHRVHASNEAELQLAVQRFFEDAGIVADRHRALSPEDIPDFMAGGAAIELKVAGSLAEVTRQLHRYAQHDAVDEIVLITTKSRHRSVPRVMNSKPVSVLVLEQWL